MQSGHQTKIKNNFLVRPGAGAITETKGGLKAKLQLVPGAFFLLALQTVSELRRVQVTPDRAREVGRWGEGEKVRVQLDKGSLLPRLNGKCHSSRQRVGRESARAADEDGGG